MLTVLLLALGVAFAWLAIDAWKLRDGARLPYSELLKLRGQQADHLTIQEQTARQAYDEKRLTGRTSGMFLVFVILGIGCFLAAALRLAA